MKKASRKKRDAFDQTVECRLDYFLFAFIAGAFPAGFMLVAGAFVDGFILLFIAGATFTGATLTGGGGATLTGAIFAGLFAGVLFADSPQAMPSAPKPRTVESKITFFILFRTPVFFSKINLPIIDVRLIGHSRFCPELFLIQGIRQYIG
jgi:hypothetical protein